MALQKQQNESQLCPKRSTYRWIPIFFKSKTTTQQRSRSQVLVDHVPGERVPPCVCVFSPQNGKGSRSASRSSEVPTRANTLTSTEFLHRSQEMSSVSLYRPLPTSAGLSHLFFFFHLFRPFLCCFAWAYAVWAWTSGGRSLQIPPTSEVVRKTDAHECETGARLLGVQVSNGARYPPG